MALAIAATAFGVARDAEAQGSDPPPEHSGAVTVAAQHPTALEVIDDLVFTVTRAVAADYDLVVPVALSSGIIDSARLSHTVTIPADNNSAVLRVHTGSLDPAAVTGDVTATVGGRRSSRRGRSCVCVCERVCRRDAGNGAVQRRVLHAR